MNQIIARIVRSNGTQAAWDLIPFAEGKGTVIRPHPNAGGGAHPRYMRQGSGFLSLSPKLHPLGAEEILCEGSFVEIVWRKTVKGENFVALLPTNSDSPTHLLVLASWEPSNDSPVDMIFRGTDETATQTSSAVESAFIVEIGQEIWKGKSPFTAMSTGLESGIGQAISASDVKVLSGAGEDEYHPQTGFVQGLTALLSIQGDGLWLDLYVPDTADPEDGGKDVRVSEPLYRLLAEGTVKPSEIVGLVVNETPPMYYFLS